MESPREVHDGMTRTLCWPQLLGRRGAEVLRTVSGSAALLASFGSAEAQEPPRVGAIRGTLLSAVTGQRLPDAAVLILDRGLDAVTRADGSFAIGGIPAGLHRVQIVLIGYESLILHDVVVRPNRITPLIVELDEAAPVIHEEVEVTADYFSTVEEKTPSTVRFAFEEIRRSPGSAGDVSRLLHALPSVGVANDQRNDLVVRGGSPTENLTVVDNIEIPNINHFPTQGASGGVIGLLHTDLIADVNFSAGGFGAEHGDRLSSALVIAQREGNRSEFDGEISMSMAGVGLLLEGPLHTDHGSWLLSMRRSYLELIADAIGTGDAVPRYSDVQAMATYDLGSAHQIRVLGLGGFDAIEATPEYPKDREVVVGAKQYVGGVNWRWLWSGNGYAETSIAHTRADHSVRVTDAAEQEARVPFENDSHEQELVMRSHWHYRPRTGTALAWGVAARRLSGDFDLFSEADRTRLDSPIDELDLRESLIGHKVGAFVSVEHTLVPRLKARLGGRFDYFSVNRQVDWSPRFGLAYDFDPFTTGVLAAGVYRQTLPSWLLVQHPDNRRLENQRANHYVAGVRRRLTPSALLSIEVYHKDYRGLPFDQDDPTALVVDQFADSPPALGRLIGSGQARSHGMEALVRKKLTRHVYGLVSYAYSVSRYTDGTGVERNRTFDHRHVASVIAGFLPNDHYEFSGRWSYASGRPYSPYDVMLSIHAGAGIVRPEQVNSERYPAYHRLDLRFSHRQYFRRFTLVSFLSLLNTYNRANVYSYYWDGDDNRPRTTTQWGFLPVGGFELEF